MIYSNANYNGEQVYRDKSHGGYSSQSYIDKSLANIWKSLGSYRDNVWASYDDFKNEHYAKCVELVTSQVEIDNNFICTGEIFDKYILKIKD